MYVYVCVCIFMCVYEFLLFVTFKSPGKPLLKRTWKCGPGVYQFPIGTPISATSSLRPLRPFAHGCVALKAKPKGRTCKTEGGPAFREVRCLVAAR